MSREELPSRRTTVREQIWADEMKIYVEVGFYADGRVGEIFLTSGRKGSAIRDIFDGLAIVLSTTLQMGIPLSTYSLSDQDSELTGKASHALRAIFNKVEELAATHKELSCSRTIASTPSLSSIESTTLPSGPVTGPTS